MAEVLVLYYSRYGATADMARLACRGVEENAGVAARLRTVPAVSAETAAIAPSVPDAGPPYASVRDLEECSGLILGSPTRFGNMTGQMRTFLDQTGGLWANGSLIGKVGSVFTSTATQHGGQETTITSFHTTLLHQGMVIVGVPYSCQELFNMDEISGGTPYGASTLAKGDGSRWPSDNELAIARFQGRHVADVASRLKQG